MISQPQISQVNPQVSSPATSVSPLPSSIEPYKEGQEICFIYNRTDVISGIITSINSDETYDLICSVPTSLRKLEWDGTPGRSDYRIVKRLELVATPFLKTSPVDPRMQVIKKITTFAELGLEPVDERGVRQSSIAGWRDSEKRSRIPRMTEFYVPLIGHFFDASLFYYKIICWRASIQVRGHGVVPEETLTFPKKKPYYTNFRKCFDRYVKEYHANLEKWNRVEIQAILPEDVLAK